MQTGKLPLVSHVCQLSDCSFHHWLSGVSSLPNTDFGTSQPPREPIPYFMQVCHIYNIQKDYVYNVMTIIYIILIINTIKKYTEMYSIFSSVSLENSNTGLNE